jgi:Mn-dependent DtxR family transcriptional regulator
MAILILLASLSIAAAICAAIIALSIGRELSGFEATLLGIVIYFESASIEASCAAIEEELRREAPYAELQRLARKGYLEPTMQPPVEARRVYRITKRGREAYDTWVRRIERKTRRP